MMQDAETSAPPPAGRVDKGAWSLRAWLELLRLPNLATVPGDPLAGMVLAAALTGQPIAKGRAVAVALSSLCLYMAGLVLNDLHDLPADREQRPERPLPSGRVAVSRARGLLAGLWMVGLGLAATAGREAFLVACLLALLIVVYDLWVKDSAPHACVTMGLCRGASLLLGGAAVGATETVLLPAAALALTVASVTRLARGEDAPQAVGVSALVPALALWSGWAAMWALLLGHAGWLAGLVSLLAGQGAFLLALGHGVAVIGPAVPPERMRRGVGRFLAGLLLWQAGLVFLGRTPGAWLCGLGLLALWPVARCLARWISPS
ncbi:MAG: UbiA family prenyltransferase [Lentisphaeria bacterium]|nr:UbiA family prenyltransferase [Lentisphaeria bacterium]